MLYILKEKASLILSGLIIHYIKLENIKKDSGRDIANKEQCAGLDLITQSFNRKGKYKNSLTY